MLAPALPCALNGSAKRRTEFQGWSVGDWEICVLPIDSACAVSKKAAEGGFFRPRMILLVLVALTLTLDYCRGAYPPAEPSFRAGLRGNGDLLLTIDSVCAVSKKAARRQLFSTTNDFACFGCAHTNP